LRIHIQRVSRAHVEIDAQVVADIEAGLLLLVGFGRDDGNTNLQDTAGAPAVESLRKVAHKVLDLRVFADPDGRFQFSARDIEAALLVVPQFTLYGRLDKGRRPDFTTAMAPASAAELFQSFVDVLTEEHTGLVRQGAFGADMQVSLVNDGPVTLLLDIQLATARVQSSGAPNPEI